MSSSRSFSLCLAALLSSACLRAWDVGGPFSCGHDESCPTGFVCDDSLCCKPGSTPACPTLPAPNGACPDGGMPSLFFQDKDGDGYGNPRVDTLRCRAPSSGWVASAEDCDDTDAGIHPGAPEACNGVDDNCNRVIDEGLNQTTFFLDQDGDGFGQSDAGQAACHAPPGYVAMGGDCAPFDATKYPGAPESCNGLDDNCNDVADALEPSFIDVDSPTRHLPCLTAGKGQCQPGVFRCAVLADGGVERRCTAVATPTVEVCDGLDNDCDGRVDQQPDCGGLPSLVGQPGVTYGALKLPSNATTATQCQKDVVGATLETATPSGTWVGTGTGFHLWYAEAPVGTTWDLSNPNATLTLAFTAAITPGTGLGVWGSPDAGATYNPVVYLCGDDPTKLMRYRIVTPADALILNETSFSQSLQLKAVGSAWLIGQSSGFDTTRVRRLELLVQSNDSFTISFNPDAGFSR